MADKNLKNVPSNTDEIVSKSEQFVEKNINKIIIAVLIVIAIVAGFFAYRHFVQKPREEKASEKMYVAEDKFIMSQDSLALNGTGVSNAGLLEIINKYGSSDAGNLAEAYAGICYFDMGKYNEALEHLKKFQSKENVVAPSIMRLMGDCYVQLDKFQEAISAFTKAADMANNEAVSPGCLLKAGHVYEKMGDYKKALEIYNKIKTQYYMAPEATLVEAEIIRATAAGK